MKNFNSPPPDNVQRLKKKLLQNGILMWVRAPVFHICPPLVISEDELNDAMDRVDDALAELDK